MTGRQRVNVYKLGDRTARGSRRPHIVQWEVDGKGRSRAFRTKVEAEDYRARLIVAQRDGERFSTDNGEPEQWNASTGSTLTAAAWCKQWFDREAPSMKPSTRTSLAEAFSRALPHLVRRRAPEPPANIRTQIRVWLADFDHEGAGSRRAAMPDYLRRWSLPLAEVDKSICGDAFGAMCRRSDRNGRPVSGVVGARTTTRYRRAMRQLFAAAVDDGLLEEQPWPAQRRGKRRVSEQEQHVTVDVRKLPSLRQALACIAKMRNHQPQSEGYVVIASVMALAGLRPSEALALRVENIELPAEGWGLLHVVEAAHTPGRFTREDERTGTTKTGVGRTVPIPSALVDLLRRYIGDRTSGLLVATKSGTPVQLSNVERAWARVRSDKGWKLYSLRHACATAWIRANPGAIREIARRLGHSPTVLTEVYAGLFDDEEDRANRLIEQYLTEQLDPPDA